MSDWDLNQGAVSGCGRLKDADELTSLHFIF